MLFLSGASGNPSNRRSADMTEGPPVHRYRARCVWTGSTGGGYDTYSRIHQGSCPPATADLTLSADPIFLGDADHLDPEQLVVLAAASCQLLSFLAAAARAGVDVVSYEDDAEARMASHQGGVRLTLVELSPRIVVARADDLLQVHELVEAAHRQCYIANSLRCPVTVDPVVNARG